jgi:hypothetical protein
MSESAVAMLIVSTAIVWGGLLLAIVVLRRHPDVPEGPFTGPSQYGPPRW